jgi:anti-anti-sigma factor
MARSFVPGEDAADSQAHASFDLDQVCRCAVVAATGEPDPCTYPGPREAPSRAAESAASIAIDLTGVGVLVGALKQNHHQQRGTLRLVSPGGPARKVLDIAHLTEVLPIHPSVEEAVTRLA